MMTQEKRLATMIKEEAAKTTSELKSNIESSNKEMLQTWQTYLDNSLVAAMKVKHMSEMPPSNNNNNNVNYNQGKSTLVNDLSSFKKHVDAILNTVQCQGCGGSVAFSQSYSLTKKRGRKPRSSLKLESPSPKSSSKSPRTSPKSMPLINQTQERLTNDLRDIMREANILEELDGEKLEQENLEALKNIEGTAASNERREEKRAGDEEVDVEGVWSPRQLLQDLDNCQKWRSPVPGVKRPSRMSLSSPRIPAVTSAGQQGDNTCPFSDGQRGRKRAFGVSTSGSLSSASSQPLTPSTTTRLADTTTPDQLTMSKPWTPTLQVSDSFLQGKSRNRLSSFSSSSSKSPFTPVSCSRPPPTPGNDCFTPSIRPIELATIKATSAEILKMRQANQVISPTTTASGGQQQLNMEMVRKGGLNKQALPPSSEVSRENVAALLDLPDYTASTPGPGEIVFHTSTSHMVHRCGLCGEDLFSATALERHTVAEHSNKKQKPCD